MKQIGIFSFWGIVTALAASTSAHAYSMGFREENAMISNGQGISSPSFWNGISGGNPAGLLMNQGIKLQGSAASFDDSTKNLRGSGGLLMGNGLIAAGAEYSTYNANPLPKGDSEINFGAAILMSTIRTTLAVAGHHYSNGADGTYDAGLMIDLSPQVRFGGMVQDFTHGLHVLGAGLTYMADTMVDFVVDAGYHLSSKDGIVKPGLSIHTDIVQATAAYGFRFAGYSDDLLVTTKFTAGLGLKISQKLLVEYEYRDLPQHRVGLTLRFN